jgi:hypothetical protein
MVISAYLLKKIFQRAKEPENILQKVSVNQAVTEMKYVV